MQHIRNYFRVTGIILTKIELYYDISVWNCFNEKNTDFIV